MKRLSVLVSIVCLTFPVTAGASTPKPDPAPNSGHKPVTLHGYTYTVPVPVTATSNGSLKIHGYASETCVVPGRWRGKPNWMGHRRCEMHMGWTFANGATQ